MDVKLVASTIYCRKWNFMRTSLLCARSNFRIFFCCRDCCDQSSWWWKMYQPLMMKRNVSIEWTMATIGNRSLALTTRCHSSDSNLFLFISSALFWACLSVSDTFQRAEAQNQRATQSVINFPITMTKTATNAIRENQIFHLTINDGTAEWYPLLEKHGGNWKCG